MGLWKRGSKYNWRGGKGGKTSFEGGGTTDTWDAPEKSRPFPRWGKWAGKGEKAFNNHAKKKASLEGFWVVNRGQ